MDEVQCNSGIVASITNLLYRLDLSPAPSTCYHSNRLKLWPKTYCDGDAPICKVDGFSYYLYLLGRCYGT
jgi:hypothetical protein